MSNPLIPANLNTGANSVSAAGALGIVQTAQMMAFPVDSSGFNHQRLIIGRGSKKSIIKSRIPEEEKIKVGPGTQRELPQNPRIDNKKNLRSEYLANRGQRRLWISSQRRLLQKNNPSHLDPKASSEDIRPENRHDQSSRAQHIGSQQASLSELFSQKESIRQNSYYECAMSNSKDRSLYTLSLSQDFDLVYTVKIGTRSSINSACSFILIDELSQDSYDFNITKLQDFSHQYFTFNEQKTNCTKLISNGIYFKIQQESNGILNFGYCQSDGAFFSSCLYSENSDILRQVTTSTPPAKAGFSCNSTVSGFKIFNDDNDEKVVELSLERNLANASFYENLISFDSEKKLILRDEYGNNYVFNKRGYTNSNAFTLSSSSADSITYSLQDAKCRNYSLTFNLTRGEVQSAIIIEGHSNVGIGFNIDSEGRLNSNGIKDGRIINYCYLNNQNPAFTENCIINEIDLKRSLVYEASFLSGEKNKFSVEITKRDNQFKNLSLAINFSGSYLGLSLNPNSSIQENFNLINQTIAKKTPSLGFLAKLEDNKIVFYGRYDGLEIKLNLRKKDDNLFEFEFENEERTCGVLSESNDVLKGTTTSISGNSTTTQLATTTPLPNTTSLAPTNPVVIYGDFTCNISSNRVMTIYNPQLQQEAEIKLIKDPKNINYTKSVNFKIGDDDFTIDYDNVTFGKYVYGDDDLYESNIAFGDRWLLKKTDVNSYEISKDNLKIRQEYVQNGEVKIRVTNNSHPILNCDFDNQGNITQSLSCSPHSLVSYDQGQTTTAKIANDSVYTGTSTNSSDNYVSMTLDKLIGYLNEYCDKFINTSSLDKPPSLLHSLNDSAIHDLMFDDNETASNNTISKKNLDNFIKNLEKINKLSPDPNISSYIEKLKSCKADEGNGPNYSLAIGLGVTSFLFLVGCIICCLNFRENEREKAPVPQNQGNQAGQNQDNREERLFNMLPEGVSLRPSSESLGVGTSVGGNEEESEAAAESEVTESPEADATRLEEVELVATITEAEAAAESEADAAPRDLDGARGEDPAGGVGFGERRGEASPAPEVAEVATRTTGRVGEMASQLRQAYSGPRAPNS